MSAESESSASGGASSWLLKIGGFVVIAGAVIGWKMWNKSGNSAEAADVIKSWVIAMPAYETNKAYLDGLVVKNHDEAFSANYSSGGRRRSAKFDSESYAKQVFEGMIRQAKADGKEELAASLTKTFAEFKAGQAEEK